MRRERGSVLTGFLVHLVLIAAVAFALYPVLWVLTLALSPTDAPEATAIPFPSDPSLIHFQEVLGIERVVLDFPTVSIKLVTDPQGRWLFGWQLFNSLLIAAVTALTAIAIATPAAYALARFEFVGAEGSTKALLATQMFPGVAAAIPLYLLLDAMHLLDTSTGLILVYATSAVPFAIFQLRGAFEGIPKELEEAAMVDGATRFGAFMRVVLPAARPALAITGLFAFMTAWNEFILASTFLTSQDHYTLPVVLQRYVNEYNAEWGAFAAGSILVSLPVMALFYALQRSLVGGLTAGGVKG